MLDPDLDTVRVKVPPTAELAVSQIFLPLPLHNLEADATLLLRLEFHPGNLFLNVSRLRLLLLGWSSISSP